MLDYKKVGNLIVKERQKINLTQEKLGEMLYVTRQAVSKWERGKCMPDYDSLLKLSELFSITLNELVAGGRFNYTNKNKINNIMIDALKEKDKKRVVLSIFFGIIVFLLLFLFLCYYFISTYNKLRVFKFSGENENYSITNIIGVFSNENSYIKLNPIFSENNQNFDYLELYYLKDNNKNILCKTSDSNILITEFNGYEEYFHYKNINDLVNNLYIDIYIDNQLQTIKLQSLELYANKSLIFKKNETIVGNSVLSESPLNVPKKIQEDFKIKNENQYMLEKNNTTLIYDANLKIFVVQETNKNNLEKWIYNVGFNTIVYQKYKNNELLEDSELLDNTINCNISKCNNHQKKYDYFIDKYILYYFN